MNTKNFVWLIALFMLLVAPSALADLTDGAYYYTMNTADISANGNISDSTTLGHDANINGAVQTGQSGILKQSIGLNATGEFIANSTILTSTNMTINAWVKIRATVDGTAHDVVGAPTVWDVGGVYLVYRAKDADSNYFGSYHYGGGAPYDLWSSYEIPLDSWHMLTWVYDGSNGNITGYINGSKVMGSSNANWAQTWKLPSFFGDNGAVAGNRLDGWLDEVGVWNRTLGLSEVEELWNGGLGLSWPFGGLPTTDVNFTVEDDFNSSSINNFSVTVSWGNGSTNNYSTSNGTIPLTNLSDDDLTVNVTFFNITDYFNLTLFSETITANTSQVITGSVYQAELNLYATEKISENNVSGATFYAGSKSGTVFNITAGTHTVNMSALGYNNHSQAFTTSALTNTTLVMTGAFTSNVNITVYQSNGSVMSGYSINLTSNNHTSWVGENSSTSTAHYNFSAINGTYEAVITNATFGTETFTFTVDNTTNQVSFYFFDMDNCSTYSQVTLNFTLWEDNTSNLVNGTLNLWFNVTSNFYTGYKEFNFSFSGGNHYKICIPNDTVASWTADAQAEYSHLPNYAEKNYYLVNYSLSNTSSDISLYLSQATTQVKLSVVDYNDDAISDVYIRVLTYDVGTNSYTTTEIVKTDTEGDAYAQMTLNTAWYAFILELDEVVLLQTLPTKITGDRIFRVDLTTDYFSNYDVAQGITHSLTYTNATTSFSFTWSEPSGSMQQGCLKLTRRTINGETVLNTSCVTSTAATILMSIPETVGTNTYVADSYAVIDGQNFALDSLSVGFNETYRTFGASGIFLSMLLILTLVLVGLWHPAAAIVLMIIGVVATNIMNLFYLNWTYLIAFVILGGLAVYRTGRSD